MLTMNHPSAGSANEDSPQPGSRPLDPVLAEVQDALRGLKYGQVVIVVQDEVVVQIDRLERRRIQRRDQGPSERG